MPIEQAPKAPQELEQAQPMSLNKLELFNNLTNNNKNELTSENLKNYFINIYESNEILNSLEKKEIYTFDDLNSIKTTNIKEFLTIGQGLVKNNLNMIVNPYNYQDSSIKIGEYVSTNNSNMLFEYNVYNNNIFVCLASDIFKAKEKLLDEEAIMKIYFSFLYSKNITNEREFIMQKVELIKKNNELINENFINKNNFIELLNTIYNNSTSLKYDNFGIKYININIHSNINSNISLESIFKLFKKNSITSC